MFVEPSLVEFELELLELLRYTGISPRATAPPITATPIIPIITTAGTERKEFEALPFLFSFS